MEEHQAVRNNVGVFDISHMGELVATGPRAGEWLNTMLTNNIAKLAVGAGQYTFLLNDDAGIIDDLIVYRIEDEKFLLVVNASRIEDDFAWLQSHLAAGGQARKPERSLRRPGHSGPADRRTFPGTLWRRRENYRREIRLRCSISAETATLGRADRVHGRRRHRGFLRRRRMHRGSGTRFLRKESR